MDDILAVMSVPWGTSLPLAPGRAPLDAFTPEWQSRTHCHSRLGAPGARPRTATRARACRLSDTSDGFLRRDTAGSGHLKGL